MATTVGTNWSLTDLNAVYDRTMQTDWIATIALSIALYLIVFWILISLVTYGVKTRKWRQTQNSDSEKLNTGMIYTSVVICAVLCLSYYTISLLYVNIGFVKKNDDQFVNNNNSVIFKKNDKMCDNVNDLLKLNYSLICFSSYMFLWLRQRAFFNIKMLDAKFNRSVKVFSVLSIFLIFAGGLSALILSSYPDNTVSSEEGCIDEHSNEDNNLFWFILFGVTVPIFGQASLLCLLVYALLSSASISVCNLKMNIMRFCTKKDCNDNNEKPAVAINPYSNSVNISSINRRSKARIQLIIKKTLVFAILSIIADTLTFVMEYTVSKSGQNKRAAVLTAQVSSFLTILFLVFSFVSWKQILMSPLKLKNNSTTLAKISIKKCNADCRSTEKDRSKTTVFFLPQQKLAVYT